MAVETLSYSEQSPPMSPEFIEGIIGRKEDYIIVAEKIAALYTMKSD